MRTSEWVTKFNISIIRSEDRPDNPPGEIVYRIKDIFTTRDGKWDPNNEGGSIPQWARDAYLRPWDAPDRFDDAGGATNIFARVLDLDGNPVKSNDLIRAWSDGLHLLADPNFNQYITMTPKQGSGWGNQPIWNKYDPDAGERGAWCWCPTGAADVICGGGLAYGWHVSTFAVWQAEKRTQGGENGNGHQPPDGGGNSGGGVIPPTQPISSDLEALRIAAWAAVPVGYQSLSAFTLYARQNGLGAPVTDVLEVGTLYAQGFALGIVYATVGEWQTISHVAW